MHSTLELEFAALDADQRQKMQEIINDTKRYGPTEKLQDAFFQFCLDTFLDEDLVPIPEDEGILKSHTAKVLNYERY